MTETKSTVAGSCEINIHRLSSDEQGYEASTRILRDHRGRFFCESGDTAEEAMKALADAICGNNPSSDASAIYRSFIVVHDERPVAYPELSRIEHEVLSDGSVVWDVVGINDRVFCRDHKSAILLHGAIQAAIREYSA